MGSIWAWKDESHLRDTGRWGIQVVNWVRCRADIYGSRGVSRLSAHWKDTLVDLLTEVNASRCGEQERREQCS